MSNKELQSIIKKHTGTCVNITATAHVFVKRAAACEQSVYTLRQLTGLPERTIINHVQGSVISYEETIKYANRYLTLPNIAIASEMYLVGGVDNWYKLNSKA